ncbi:glycosyltransferase [Cytophagaceae bacterium ABcell3]|nr:glycosyltransferase [Cytophagaceae bacterium ABcell3]
MFKREIRSYHSSAGDLQTEPLRVSIIVSYDRNIFKTIRIVRNILNNTIYPNYEVVVVGHISSISKNVLNFFFTSSKLLFVKGKHLSEVEAKNRAVNMSTGFYLVFCEPYVQPLRGWLINLVIAHSKINKPGAIGGKTVFSFFHRFANSFKVEQAGIAYRQEDGAIKPYKLYEGADYSSACVCASVERPAVNHGLFLISKEAFLKVGGFSHKYTPYLASTDLFLKLISTGYVNYYCADSVSLSFNFNKEKHFERGELISFKREWQGFLKEKVNAERFSFLPGFWTQKNLTIGVVVSEEAPYGSFKMFLQTLYDKGANVKYYKSGSDWYNISYEVDVLIVTVSEYDPTLIIGNVFVLKIFWAISKTERFDMSYGGAYDLFISPCLSSSAFSKVRRSVVEFSLEYDKSYNIEINEFFHKKVYAFLDIIQSSERSKRVAVLIAAPDLEFAHEWGDYHFALALRKNMERVGNVQVRIYTREKWYSHEVLDNDVVVVLRGIHKYHPAATQINFMWLISHPADVSMEELYMYDHIFVASELFVQKFSGSQGLSISVLHQCTDTEVFFPVKDDRVNVEVLYVGNSRNVLRESLRLLLPTDKELQVYGSRWEGLIPTRYIKGRYIDNDQLKHYYSNARVLLNDHWSDMKEEGFISNRVFDALACKANLVSDIVYGMDKLFDNKLMVYSSRKELYNWVDRCVGGADEIEEKREALYKQVISEHTFERRAKQILAYVEKFQKYESN